MPPRRRPAGGRQGCSPYRCTGRSEECKTGVLSLPPGLPVRGPIGPVPAARALAKGDHHRIDRDDQVGAGPVDILRAKQLDPLDRLLYAFLNAVRLAPDRLFTLLPPSPS